MEKDVQRFAQMVTEYRGTAREILKRAYHDKVKADQRQVRPADRPQRSRGARSPARRDRDVRGVPAQVPERQALDAGRDVPPGRALLREVGGGVPGRRRGVQEGARRPEPARHAAAAGRLHADHQPLPPPADRVPELPLPRRRLLPARLLPGRDGRGACRPSRRCWRWSAPTASSRSTRRPRRRSRRRAAPGAPPPADEDFYKECTPVRKESKFIPEAWTRVGEFHFDNPNELRLAIAAFRKVLTFKDSPYYDRALYKLAWSYYRDNRFPEAVREFDNLVKYADARTAAGQKVGSDLRPEAVQYLGVSFAEPDWDGDTLPDADQRPAARDGLLQGPREGAARARGVPAPRRHLLRPDQIRRRDRRLQGAAAASGRTTSTRRACRTASSTPTRRTATWSRPPRSARCSGRSYTKGSDWYQHNKDNPEALAVARQLAEDALLTAATNVHAAAQACKTQVAGEPEGHARSWRSARSCTRPAPSSTRSSWPRIPNSKRSYEFAAFYADALYYSGQLQAGDRRLQDRARLAARQPVPGRRRVPDDQDVRRDHRRA